MLKERGEMLKKKIALREYVREREKTRDWIERTREEKKIRKGRDVRTFDIS